MTTPGDTSMSVQTDKAAIRAVIQGIDKAHQARDASAIVAPFASDAVLFDLAPPLARNVSLEDTIEWLNTWRGPVTRETHQLDITVGGDIAFARCYFHTGAMTADGGDRAEWWSRATLCLRRDADRWVIVHEHTSVPFYMDGSFRAALDLTP